MRDADEPYRIVVDETSLDFRGLTTDQLTDLLDAFNDALEEILADRPVARAELWDAHQCLDGCELWQFLYEPDSPGRHLSPDVRRRLALLMENRCRAWDADGPDDTPDTVTIAGQSPRALAWTLGHALTRTLHGYTTACLVLPTPAGPRGWVPVSAAETDTAELYFVANAEELTFFWRGLYEREDVPEQAFRRLATDAFPGLVLLPSLSFRRFIGSYRQLRSWVTRVLAVLDDHFADALSKHAGIPDKVQAELGRFGIDLSPESKNTHANPSAMRQRRVHHEGEDYVCEWHAKQHPTRNRIHFTLPEQRLGGRILVGIFVDHLDT